jgi:hypothetical protein
MNIHTPLRRQALAGALVLMLAAACLPAPQPTLAPEAYAPTLPPAATPVPADSLAPTAAPAIDTVPTSAVAYTTAASDFSKMPDPLAGWQAGDRSVPITITEYGDFQ